MKTDYGIKPLLELQGVKKYYPIEQGFLKKTVGYVKAVDEVSLTLYSGETLALVGESGCGKTTLGRCILRVLEPTSGSILFRPDDEEIDLSRTDKKRLRSLRRHMQMIFQDPFASLDPRMTVLDIVGEPLIENGIARGKALAERVRQLMTAVGLDVKHLNRFPHAFSGGQRQRIGIARALAPEPRLIVCDEPVSALDVSVQAQILNLLVDLQAEYHLAYLFISHDLAVVEHIADRVAVMYVGRIVELAAAPSLFKTPRHPYTEALLDAVPHLDPDYRPTGKGLIGEIANPAEPPSGCYFHPRCPYAEAICKTEKPDWVEVETGHFSACHFARDLSLRGVD